RRHVDDPIAISALAPNERIQSAASTDVMQTLDVSLQSSRQATFHRFEWPYWRLFANGTQLLTKPHSIGRATAILPRGQYRAEWRLERSPLERAGLWVSGIAWSALLFLGGRVLYRRYRQSP